MNANPAKKKWPATARTETDCDVLRRLIDWSTLCRLGWDPASQVFAPAGSDPVFGFAECATAGCEQVRATNRFGLCWRCLGCWRRSAPGISLEEFCRRGPEHTGKAVDRLCLVCRVPGHERPVHWQSLCGSCCSSMLQHGQSVTEYLNGDEMYPPAEPRALPGRGL